MSTESLDPAALAADTLAAADGGLSLEGLIGALASRVSLENLMIQAAVVLAAVVIGKILSRMIDMRMMVFSVKLSADGPKEAGERLEEARNAVVPYLKRFAAALVRNVSFSFPAGLLVALGTYAIVSLTSYGASSLIICRAAYNLLFAYTILRVVLAFLHAVAGEVVTAKATRMISAGFWVLAVLQFFGILSDLVDFMQATSLPIGAGKVTIWTVFVAAVTLCITLLIANWAAGRVDQIIHRSQSLSANLRVALSRVVRILLYVVAVIIGLNSVGVDLSILSVFGGAMGVGIGFGLQKIASNYISGFIILLDRSIKIGDLVNVAGFRGRITEINIRYTVVRNSDGVECIVPNENFVTSTVQNFSYTETDSVSYVDISVAYDADVKRALEIMLEEGMRERPRIAKGKRGWAYLESFGDSGINLRLAFWVKDPANGTVGLKTAISLAVYERFQKEGIEVPFNRLDVNILPRADEAAAGAKS